MKCFYTTRVLLSSLKGGDVEGHTGTCSVNVRGSKLKVQTFYTDPPVYTIPTGYLIHYRYCMDLVVKTLVLGPLWSRFYELLFFVHVNVHLRCRGRSPCVRTEWVRLETL